MRKRQASTQNVLCRKKLNVVVAAAFLLSGVGVQTEVRAAEPAANKNYMGLNVVHPNNSTNAPVMADVMKGARSPWYYNTTNKAPVDADGWATVDTSTYLTDGTFVKNVSGTYKLRFNGQATIGGWGISSVQNQSYNSSTNTTTADLIVTSLNPTIRLDLTNTKRTSTSATNTGVTNIQLMRPVSPGSSTAYAFTDTFTNQIKTIAGKFQSLRFMDFRATNGNNDINWTDRVYPLRANIDPPLDANGNSTYGWQGKGGAWEYTVQLANETNCDMWINIPVKASNDYITKLAQLIRYGSDGINPYTSTQASPRFAPLNSGLKVYVEYSNELWNNAYSFTQGGTNQSLATAEVQAGGSPLNYDGSTDDYTWARRRMAKRTVEISQMFRTVWGNSNMMTRVRPLYEWQYGDGQGTGNVALAFIDNWYNNADGNHVATPHPVNYFLWGGGSASYYNPIDINSDTLTVDQILNESDVSKRPAQWDYMKTDIGLTTAYGLKRAAYEGGLGQGDDPAHSFNVKKQVLADARLQNVVKTNQDIWSNYGGDLFMYFESSDGVGYGHTDENFSTSTQKLQAIDSLNAGTKAAITLGVPVPATIAGNNWQITSRGWGTPASTGSLSDFGTVTSSYGVPAIKWVSYMIRVPSAGNYSIKVNYSSTTTSSMKIEAGGNSISTVSIPNTGGAATDTATFTASLGAGLSSVRLVAPVNAANFTINSVTVSNGGSSTPTPTPTPTPTATPTPTPGSGLVNGSFETPNVGTANYAYNISGGTWTFVGNSGIQSNGSGWGAPSATDGVQTAFIQGQSGSNGAVSQSFNWTAGSYTVSFKAAQRNFGGANTQGIKVYLDTTLVATITPSSTSFATYTTPSFNVTAGAHTLKLEGNSASGDNTAFVDQVGVNQATSSSGLANSSFESPALSSGYQYNPTGGTWTFAGNSGIQKNGSIWAAPSATDGVQTAFIQGQNGSNGAVSQSFDWTAGSRTVSFKAAQRNLGGANNQGIKVYLDTTLVATITPSSTSFATYTTPSFNVTAGAHTLKLEGNSASGDNTAFVDQVSVN